MASRLALICVFLQVLICSSANPLPSSPTHESTTSARRELRGMGIKAGHHSNGGHHRNKASTAAASTADCHDPPSPITEDDVNSIPIGQIIGGVPFMNNTQFVGETCSGHTPGSPFPPGEWDLCLIGSNKNGLIRSPDKQAYGVFSADIKCASQGNSSGLVTTFYATSDFGNNHQDEIDYEFLNRYNTVLQINTWRGGESVFFKNVYLGFDCSQDFHNYAIYWTPQVLVWYIDYKQVAFYPNTDSSKYPQAPSYLVSSFWDGSGFDANSYRWCGLRDPSTMGTEFKAEYKNIKLSKPIYNAFCASKYI